MDAVQRAKEEKRRKLNPNRMKARLTGELKTLEKTNWQPIIEEPVKSEKRLKTEKKQPKYKIQRIKIRTSISDLDIL